VTSGLAPDAGGEAHPRLRRFLALLGPIFLTLAMLQVAAAIAFGSIGNGIGAAVLFTYGCVLLVARAELGGGRLVRSLVLTAAGLVVTAIAYALLVPSASMAAVVAPVLAVAIVLPYLEREQLRGIIVACWVASVAIVVLVEVIQPANPTPAVFQAATRIAQLAAVVGLVMYLLWEFSSRLKAALAEEAAANAASSEAKETVKRVNRELRRRVQELERRNREATLVGHMGSLLEVSRTSDEAYEVIERASRTLFPGTSGAVFTLPESRVVVEATARWGQPAPKTQVFAPEDCWALRQGRLHVVEAPEFGPRCAHTAADPERPYLCIPMTAQGTTLGVFHVAAAGRTVDGRLDPDLRTLALWVAELLALSLANFRLRETLHLQSTRDSLTGLYNRRYMEETLEREIHRAIREGGTLGVIMVDLDRFKAYNDRFGHAAGDALLRSMAESLAANIRAEDVACRYGGEEFTIILPNASKDETRRRAEVLRAHAPNVSIPTGDRPGITLSLGVAAFPDDGSSADALLGAADRALYRAKAEGRDRVEVAVAV
jgi:diguanylate cyclase (GGDEF)-like protein